MDDSRPGQRWNQLVSVCQWGSSDLWDPLGLCDESSNQNQKTFLFTKGTTEEEIILFNKALEHISQSERGRELISNIEQSDVVITISFNYNDNVYYYPQSKTIEWDPFSGLRTGSGEIQLPSLSLAHELGHVEQDIMGELEGRSIIEIEEENLRRTETPIAKQLDLPVRSNYFDVCQKDPFPRVIDPTSSIPVN